MVTKYLSTLGPLGYLPASGTFGSLVALPLIYFFSQSSLVLIMSSIMLLSFVSFFIINNASHFFKSADPSMIILDEFVGCCWAFVGLPFTHNIILITFFLFRFLDITKVLGIHKFEKLPHSYGILFDDIVAGILTNILIRGGLALLL